MSDQEVPTGSMRVQFPDGTSKVFRGTSQGEISAQAKAHWASKQPKVKQSAPAPKTATPQVPAPNPYALPGGVAANAGKIISDLFFIPGDAVKAIIERVENKVAPTPNKYDRPEQQRVANLPFWQSMQALNGQPVHHLAQPHELAAYNQDVKALHPILQAGVGVSDVAAEAGTNPITYATLGLASMLPPVAQVTLGTGFGVQQLLQGTDNVYQGIKNKDYRQAGQGAADMSLGALALKGTAAIRDAATEPPPAAKPKTTRGLSSGPSEPPPAPEPEPDTFDASFKPEEPPKQEQKSGPKPPPRDSGPKPPPRDSGPKASAKPPPEQEPRTPHPEVDRFNTYADKVDARISETADVLKARKRLNDLVAKRKLTQAEKIERAQLAQKVDLHKRGVEELATRYEQATGKKLNVTAGTGFVGDTSVPTGRAELFDMIRNGLRAGHTTFGKLFPESGIDVEDTMSDTVSRETPKAKRFSAFDDSPSGLDTAPLSRTLNESVHPAEERQVNAQADATHTHTPGLPEGEPEHGTANNSAADGGRIEVSGDVPKPPKLLASEKGKIRDALVGYGPRTIYRAASNTLHLNPIAEDMLRWHLHTRGDAWTLTKGDAEKLAAHLDRGKGIHLPEMSRKLAADIRAASAQAPGGAVIFQPVDRVNRGTKNARHENVHAGQADVRDNMAPFSEGTTRNLLTPEQNDSISRLPGWDKAQAALTKYYAPERVFSEIPAYIASGDHSRLGLSDQEAEDIVLHYAYHVMNNYGPDAVAKVFHTSVGKARKLAKMTGGKAAARRSPATAQDFRDAGIDVDEAMPHRAGAGPVGKVFKYGPAVTNVINEFDAAHTSAQVRAELMSRDVLKGLSDSQAGDVGDYLIGHRLNWASKMASDPALRAKAAAHPQYLSDADLSRLVSDPKVKDAAEKYKDFVKPVIDDLSIRAGVSAQAIAAQSPYYIRLVSPEFMQARNAQYSASHGSGASWESKGRPKSTGARKAAGFTGTQYVTDVSALLRHVVKDTEPKARLNDLWRTLDREGLIVTRPRNSPNWTPPDGFVSDEVQGKYSSAPADIRGKYGDKAVVFMPREVRDTIDEITRPEGPSGSPLSEGLKNLVRAGIWAGLALNPVAVPGHIYRQTSLVRGATKLQDVKSNPVWILGSVLPPAGTLAKGAQIATRDVDNPIYQQIMQDLVQANAISPRALESSLGHFGKLPAAARYQRYMHELMFGMPEGRGIKGWAIRCALEGELVRRRFEQNSDPERMREFSSKFGFYTRRLAPFLGGLAKINPFARTTAARYRTSLEQFFGNSGLKAANLAARAGLWAGSFALSALEVIGALVLINKALSGKWSWENDKGHELDINLGGGHYLNLAFWLPQAEVVLQVSGLRSRMHREQMQSGVTDSGFGRDEFSSKVTEDSSPLRDAAGDFAVGAVNTLAGLTSNPGTSAAFGLIGRHPYFEYQPGQQYPIPMPSQPKDATVPVEVYNFIRDTVGGAQIAPKAGYADTDYAQSVIDYLTQHAIKTDRQKAIKAKKFGR